MMAAYVRVPWRGCITIQGLWRRVTSSSSRDGHNSATWTPVLGTTRRHQARDTLIGFYKHFCLSSGAASSDPHHSTQSQRSKCRALGAEKTERKCWKRNGSPEVPCLYLHPTLEPVVTSHAVPSLDTLSAPGHSWLATGHHRDSQLRSVCVLSQSCPSVLRL